MNYHTVEETLRANYRDVSPRYRRDDEVEVTTENHRHISGLLRNLCSSFGRPIHVLDVGCGTGRYFHCLTNVETLTGIDISDEMLEAAQNPVRKEQISVGHTRLLRENIYLTETFAPGSFHLIYSLGMFGNGCPVTAELCTRFHDWLMPGGILYFNTVDTAGLPVLRRMRRQARHVVWPLLSRQWKDRLVEREARHPACDMTQRALERVMDASRFPDYRVESHVCRSPLWEGRHLECVARKAGAEHQGSRHSAVPALLS